VVAQVFSLIKLLVGIVYLMHLLGCVWFYLHLCAARAAHPIPSDDAYTPHSETVLSGPLSSPDSNDRISARDERVLTDTVTWLTTYDGGSGVHAGVWVQYLYSIYWALTTLTTVGYGDITPTNDLERVYALISLLIGALVFGSLLSALGDALSHVDPNASRTVERLAEVKEYLRWHRVPASTSRAVRKYLEFYFSRRSARDDDDGAYMLRHLTPALRREIDVHLLSATVAKLPLFAHSTHGANCYVSIEFQLMVHPLLKPLLREAKEVILSKHAYNHSIFFLSRGNVSAAGDLGMTFFSLNTQGVFFGEEALFERPAALTCTAEVRCELFLLAVSDLATIAATLRPEARDELAENILEQHFKHAIARNVALHLFSSGMTAALLGKTLGRSELCAVRMQRAYFVKRLTLLAGEDAPPLDELMPGLYDHRGSFANRRRERHPAVPLARERHGSMTIAMPDASRFDTDAASQKLMRWRGSFGNSKSGSFSKKSRASAGSVESIAEDEESDAAVEQPPPLVLSAASDLLSAASNASDDASGSRPVTHAFIDRLHPALQHHYRHRAEPQRIMEASAGMASAGMASAGMASAAPASSDAPVAEAARRAERWRRQLVEPVAEAVPSSGEVATVHGAMVQRIEAGVADAVELAVKAAAARIEERMNAKVAAEGELLAAAAGGFAELAKGVLEKAQRNDAIVAERLDELQAAVAELSAKLDGVDDTPRQSQQSQQEAATAPSSRVETRSRSLPRSLLPRRSPRSRSNEGSPLASPAEKQQ